MYVLIFVASFGTATLLALEIAAKKLKRAFLSPSPLAFARVVWKKGVLYEQSKLFLMMLGAASKPVSRSFIGNSAGISHWEFS